MPAHNRPPRVPAHSRAQPWRVPADLCPPEIPIARAASLRLAAIVCYSRANSARDRRDPVAALHLIHEAASMSQAAADLDRAGRR